MTYNSAHYYCTFGGDLFGGLETWQTGVRFSPQDGPNPDPSPFLDALPAISLPDILQDWTELITNAATLMWSNAVRISWAKLAVIKTDGKYAGDPLVAEQTPAAGSSGANAFAPQLSTVVSLWSGSGLGRANHGRCYLPVPQTFLTSMTVLAPWASTAQCDALRDLFRTKVSQVTGEISTVGFEQRPSIMSQLGTGTTRFVAQVGVGRVIDTMRSRRQALTENTNYSAL